MRYILAFSALLLGINEGFTPLTIVIIAFAVWSIPLTWVRVKFRQAVYNTTDWKIAVTPQFWKELKVIFGFEKIEQVKLVRLYRLYLLGFIWIYVIYKIIE